LSVQPFQLAIGSVRARRCEVSGPEIGAPVD
jgi:hypothetical protein